MRPGDDEQAFRLPYAATDTGGRFAVRLMPQAPRNGLDGVAPGPDGWPAPLLRVAAPPVEGAANAALVGYVAEALGLRRSDVAVVSGARGRSKTLELSGDADALLARLAEWVGGGRRAP